MANHVTLHYVEEGLGMPVVLLHGFPLSSDIWRAQREKLSPQFRIITPDLRGHGRSPTPPGIYEMDVMAADVLAMLDSLSIQQAVIMGHSMGGYVTLACWRLAPERFLGLGLIASQAGADTDEARQGRYKTAEKVAAEGSKVVAETMLPKLFAPGLPLDAPIAAQARQLIAMTSAEGIIAALQGMAVRPDSSPLLPALGVPALIVAGAQDQIVVPAKAQAMAAVIPRVTLTMIDQAGHMPMLEQPAATTKALRDFLAGIAK
jgi:3-oxoadipate enol-lactonase